MLDDVNKHFVFKSLLTTPSNVLPLHLKQIFPPIIWIFTEGEDDGIKTRLPFKTFSTLLSNLYTVPFRASSFHKKSSNSISEIAMVIFSIGHTKCVGPITGKIHFDNYIKINSEFLTPFRGGPNMIASSQFYISIYWEVSFIWNW